MPMFAGYLRPAISRSASQQSEQRPVTAAFGLKRLAIAAAALIAAVLIAVIGVYSLLPAASVRDAVKAGTITIILPVELPPTKS